jgi:hypothetical protein
MTDVVVPDRLLRISDAVNRLAEGMWGGLPQPDPVRTIKQNSYKLSVGFGRWREQAGQRFRAAALEGKLVVYLSADTQASSKSPVSALQSTANIEPVVVAIKVLERLLISRGSLPDHPIRPTIKTAGGDEKLFALLNRGILVVSESDFDVWYRAERARGKWASQRSKSKTSIGRPTKQTEALRNAVVARLRDGAWDGKEGIMKLHRLLVSSGVSDVPSPDTLARLVDQLFSETGEPGLLRVARVRRKRA